MIRSDYCAADAVHATAPRPSTPPALVSVRRALARARDAADARSARGRRAWLGSRWWAARPDRARAASCGSSRTGSPAEGALVLYGACDSVVRHALPALRRGARPARSRHRPMRSERTSAARAASSPRLLPDLALASVGCHAPVAADPDTERHRLHTRGRPTSSRSPVAGRRCCSSSRTATGRTRRRSLLLRHLARAGIGGLRARARRRSETPRPTFRARSPTRSPTCAAQRASCGCDLGGLSSRRCRRVRRASRSAGELGPAELRGLPARCAS